MERMEWKISVPIFKNTLILKQLGIALGGPFLLIAIIVSIASGKTAYLLYGLGIFAGLLLLTWLLLLVLYRGNYDAEFVLDDEGALCRTQAQQAKKNGVINTLTFLMGLFSGRPGVAATWLLAQSRQSESLAWKRVKKVQYDPKSHTILLKGTPTENVALFCTPDNYEQVEATVRLRTEHLNSEGAKA